MSSFCENSFLPLLAFCVQRFDIKIKVGDVISNFMNCRVSCMTPFTPSDAERCVKELLALIPGVNFINMLTCTFLHAQIICCLTLISPTIYVHRLCQLCYLIYDIFALTLNCKAKRNERKPAQFAFVQKPRA